MGSQVIYKRFKIFIGYDEREGIAYEVLRHSILRNTTTPVDVIPLKHTKLRRDGLFRRPWLTEAHTGLRIDLIDGKPFSTEFSHTRFLVPHLMQYHGWALFMDCDMLFTCDIKELIELADDRFAMMCVKHRHIPKEGETKMDNMQVQSKYPRKNWSSFVLWNCGHHRNRFMTPDKVNTMTGTDLHSFGWIPEEAIGALDSEWNWIEGISPVSKGMPKVIHYTNGGPWFYENAQKDGMYFDLWEAERKHYRKYGEDIIVGKGRK